MTVAAICSRDWTPQRRMSVTRRAAGRGRAELVAVSVRGEVDASNAKDFADAVCAAVVGGRSVRLDLSELDFMAIDGVSALHAINAHMARAAVSWCVVPGAAAFRVLTLSDPEQLIPVHGLRAPQAALRLVETLVS